MKNKTSKLAKLEKERYSIMTDDLEHCYICGNDSVDLHEVYAGTNRKMSMKNGFCLPLCRTHHRIAQLGKEENLFLKKMFQKKYEENHTREEFIKLVGRNYDLD